MTIRTIFSAAVLAVLCSGCSWFRSEPEDSAKQAGTPDRLLVLAMGYPGTYTLESALSRGADPNARDENGTPVLILAAAAQKPDHVQLLLQAGADVNQPDSGGDTAIHAAASGKNLEILRMTAAAKNARIDSVDALGRTPAMEAARLGRIDNVKFLAEKGADLRRTDKRGATIVAYAAAAPENSVALIDFLRSKQVPSLAESSNVEVSPVVAALSVNNTEAVKHLLEEMPPLDSSSDLQAAGQIAMRFAIKNNNLAVAEELVKKKLRLNTKLSLVFRAAEFVSTEGIYKLMARNGIVDNGYTPLIWACIMGRPEIVELLIKNGANPYIRSEEGKTAFAYANDAPTFDALKRAVREKGK